MKRVNFITLGVQNLSASKKFFLDLFGWQPKESKSEDIAFYDMGGLILALYPWSSLAEEITVAPEGNGFRGVALAHNVASKTEVAEMLAKAKSCGATIVKEAHDAFWGGHSGYFQDLDGFYWEVAWNPYMPVLEDGTLKLE